MHDLGDPFTAAFQNTVNEALTNATTAVLTVTLPDGTTATPTVSHPSTGRYSATYTPAQAGRHVLRWVSTGPGARAQDDVLNVHSASTALISLDEAKAHLNFDDEDQQVDDEELRAVIAAATGVVERHTGEAVARRVVVEDHDLPSATWVLLHRAPVISVTAVVAVDGSTTYDVADFTLDGNAGLVTGPPMGGLTRVTYVAGRVEVPANYLLATQIITAHLWQTQRMATLGRQPDLGGEDVLTPSGLGYAIPSRAVELLGPRGPNPP